MAFIISADELKETLPGYDPKKSEEFHHESAKLADKAYMAAIKSRTETDVVLLSGGAASGKTEYLSVYLKEKRAIILDGTLPGFEGAKIKIRGALKYGKTVDITAVMPERFDIAFDAFLGRERKFPPEHFFRTHSTSRKTLLDIAEHFPDVHITLIDSDYNNDGSMSFTKIVFFEGRDALLKQLHRRQYTEQEIRNRIFHAA
jgi:hypothetical protein